MNNSLPPKNDIVSKTRDFLNANSGGSSIPTVQPRLKGMTNILDALLSKGLISAEQFNSVKFEALNGKKSIDQLLLEHKLVSIEDIVKTYSEIKGIPYVNLKEITISLDTLNKIPVSVARTSWAIAFEESPTSVKIAMKDPLDLQKIKYLEALVGKKVESFYTTEDSINYVIDTKYGAQISKEVDEALLEVGGEESGGSFNRSYFDTEIGESMESAPIIKIVNMIFRFWNKK